LHCRNGVILLAETTRDHRHGRPRFDLIEHRVTIARGVRALPDRERKILYLRLAEGLTQAEIAQRMGLSQMHISRLIRRAIDRVRAVSAGD
jgi:RNA polymerase sigma-B factor